MYRWMLVAALCGLPGCGGESLTDHSRDPEAFAVDVKELVATTVAEAQVSLEPVDALFSLVDLLDELDQQPAGSHRELYEQIQKMASEIHEMAEQVDGRPADLEQRLDRLWALAEPLPGDVTPEAMNPGD